MCQPRARMGDGVGPPPLMRAQPHAIVEIAGIGGGGEVAGIGVTGAAESDVGWGEGALTGCNASGLGHLCNTLISGSTATAKVLRSELRPMSMSFRQGWLASAFASAALFVVGMGGRM